MNNTQVETSHRSENSSTIMTHTHGLRCPRDRSRTAGASDGGILISRRHHDHKRPALFLLPLILGALLVVQGQISLTQALGSDAQQQQQQQHELASSAKPTAAAAAPASDQAARSTQPSVDRQVDTPNSSSIVSAPSVTGQGGAAAKEVARASKNEIASSPSSPSSQSAAGKPKQQQTAQQQRKYAASQQQNYDKYQLKATNSQRAAPSVVASSSSANNDTGNSSKDSASQPAAAAGAKADSDSRKPEEDKQSSEVAPLSPFQSGDGGSQIAHKKAAQQQQQQQQNRVKTSSSFSLLKRLLPAFMTSAGPAAAAAAAAAASAAIDKHQMSHSRSSSSSPGAGPLSVAVGSFTGSGDGPLSRASGKLINYILSGSKKSGAAADGLGAVPDHAPFFIRKPAIDRQAGGFASSLLSKPLIPLGLLFSAPLIPSLLLTPLAIAGLSPAMSAINNFFDDDEETSGSGSTPAASQSSPLSILTGPQSPLSSILQGSNSPYLQAIPSSGGSAPAAASSSLAVRTLQSFFGVPSSSTTEKPLFNPGMFASQGIQNALANVNSGSSSSSSSPSNSLSSQQSGSSGGGSSPIRSFLGGNLIQTAASMISPSFADPNSSGSGSSSSSSSSSDSDDGPGLMEMASSVFDRFSNYMTTDKDSISQASSNPAQSAPASALSSLVSLSNFSPFQLSSLLASSPFAAALAPASSSSSSSSSSGVGGHSAPTQQRAGFFSTLKNVYELFSSSFLRRQADAGDSNECQQRLICELHQRAMNSKLFRRSVQANLMELANLDRNLQEQIANNPMQARVDADTKAMLNDFLKASNNFKNGRDVVDCAKMFPKCSRAMLLSMANSHLLDPKNGKALGKFSNFMKKMKFKSAQQHQSQWKLRKPAKVANSVVQQAPRVAMPGGQYQPTDYMQVAPMSTLANGANGQQPGQLTPADSLKLVQQIMMMSQQQQQQQQQQSQAKVSNPIGMASEPAQYYYPAATSDQQQQQQSNQMYMPAQQAGSSISYQPTNYGQQQQQQQQYPQATNGQAMTNIYTDAVPQMYSSSSPTNSPYYSSNPSQSYSIASDQMSQQAQYQSNQPQQQQQQQYQQYPAGQQSSPQSQAMAASPDKKMQLQLQQQAVSSSQQQLKPISSGSSSAAIAAA